MNVENLVTEILSLQVEAITKWYNDGVSIEDKGILGLVAENHAYNFRLWLAEDRARREDKGFEFVYNAKREIDSCNQQRNNKMEEIDSWFYKEISPAVDGCQVNSETPGMMIDRLSIMALKLHHMLIQANRRDVDAEHRSNCERKAQVIAMQKQQLAQCMRELLHEVTNKTRTFRVYHQFKMYNDPKMNPELYSRES